MIKRVIELAKYGLPNDNANTCVKSRCDYGVNILFKFSLLQNLTARNEFKKNIYF